MPVLTSTEGRLYDPTILRDRLPGSIERICVAINEANESVRLLMEAAGLPPEDVFTLVQNKSALDKIMTADAQHLSVGLVC